MRHSVLVKVPEMNNIVSIETSRALPSDHPADDATEMLVQEMANQLYAGIMGGLNTANTQDVIAYLYAAPQRYHYRLILDHFDAALYLAKQNLLACEMSKQGEV